LESAIIRDEDIYIKGVGARGNVKIPVTLLTQIISVRMRELFSLIDNELRQTGFKNKIKAGVVLTGGGSLLKGCPELAEEVFGLPARIGVPLDLGSGLSGEVESPEFATVAGLIKGIPGKTTAENFTTVKTGSEKKLHTGKVFRKIQDFFDNL
jgi:cell division protein FtsA